MKYPEVRWAEVARRALEMELERLHVYDRLLEGSALTEADAVELGREIRRRAAKGRA